MPTNLRIKALKNFRKKKQRQTVLGSILFTIWNRTLKIRERWYSVLKLIIDISKGFVLKDNNCTSSYFLGIPLIYNINSLFSHFQMKQENPLTLNILINRIA